MKRYAVLDEIRGAVFISMFIYHGMWDLVYLFGWENAWYTGLGGYIWQQSICWTFILLSGFCWSLGRKKWKHGWSIFLTGAGISLVTVLFLPKSPVIFGILTFLGSAALILNLIESILKRVRPIVGITASFFFFFLTRNINAGYLGFEKLQWKRLPDLLYRNLFTTFIGFTEQDFYSTDYFSIFPWLFLYLAGYFLFRAVKENQKGKKSIMNRLEKERFPLLGWIGRHSLILYVLHQPLLYSILYLC